MSHEHDERTRSHKLNDELLIPNIGWRLKNRLGATNENRTPLTRNDVLDVLGARRHVIKNYIINKP